MPPAEAKSFDAEYYLRRHAEDELGSEEDRVAPERARALVVLRLLPLDRARAVLQVYDRARGLRNGELGFDGDVDDGDGATAPHTARVVELDHTLAASFGKVHLRHVVFTERRVRAAVDITFGKQGHPRHMHGHRGLSLDVTDDRGNVAQLGFSGGGGSTTWKGHFTSRDGLSLTTRWIEVLGERLELADRPVTATVTVRKIIDEAEQDPAVRAARYLERCLDGAKRDHWRPSPVPAVLETIIASGSLAADDPAVVAARAVGLALSTGKVADPGALPARWRSVLDPGVRPRGRRAPKGGVLIGAVTPSFDGITVVVHVLTSQRGNFEVELDGYGTLTDRLGDDEDGEPPLAFTATDDLGNRYFGQTREWHSGGEEFGGTVLYEPALAASATRLDLVFASPQTEAVVSVPLRWAAS